MIDIKALKYYLDNIRQSVISTMKSLKEFKSFVESITDCECRKKLMQCCVLIFKDIDNVVSDIRTTDYTLDEIEEYEQEEEE